MEQKMLLVCTFWLSCRSESHEARSLAHHIIMVPCSHVVIACPQRLLRFYCSPEHEVTLRWACHQPQKCFDFVQVATLLL